MNWNHLSEAPSINILHLQTQEQDNSINSRTV